MNDQANATRHPVVGTRARRLTLPAALWCALGFVPRALAQQSSSTPTSETPWMQWLLFVAFVLLCCGIAFKNPKRTHLG